MSKQGTMRALIYTRVSLDPRGQGRSVDEQETECREWAAREGWTITGVISETGSASRYARSTRSRTRWDELTTTLAAGNTDLLLTWEASRATRQLEEYAQLRALCATHGILWGYSGTIHDLTQRDARFRTGLDALLAEDESARTSERILRSVRARATQGRPHGKLPYGYRREYDPSSGALQRQVPDETTAPIVREIITRVLDGEPLRAISLDLDQRAIPRPRPPRTRQNNTDRWLTTTIRRIALNPTYAALRVHQGQIIGDAAWEPLITRDQHEQAVAILTNPERQTRTGDSTARHLLSGIARCSECGTPLGHLTNRGRYHAYICRETGCHGVARTATPLDNHVTSVVLTLLASVTATPHAPATPALVDAQADLDALETRLESFALAAADGQVSPGSLARIEERLLPQIKEARARVDALRIPTVLDQELLDDPHAWWDTATLAERRQLLRDTVRVTVHKAPKTRVFNPSYVDITPLW